jgi:hypothetical protein
MRRRLVRAFTLVELMVALTGGLVFSIFVFMLTRDVTRFFQQETGLSDATAAMLTGYQRLRADVQRAGFLASPNLVKDVGRCPARFPLDAPPTDTTFTAAPWSNFPLLPTLALARVTTGTTTAWLTANGLAPDELILYGNYTSADQYPVRAHVADTASIFLDPNSEELARAGFTTATATATLARLFPAGSIVRVVSANTGEEQYSIVAGVNGGTVAINLDPTFFLKPKTPTTSCGLRGVGADLVVNPVNVIRYRLGSMSGNAAFAALYAGTGGGASAEAGWPRLDLLREELNPNGTGTLSQELVTEFAVDFRVGAQVFVPGGTGLQFYPEGDTANLPNYVGPSTASGPMLANRGPHLIRALRPRLAVRTRSPDRQANVASGAGLYRVPLTGTGGNASDFARVRTLQSLIMTRNTRSRVWN